MNRLEGQVAFITGGEHGIGRTAAQRPLEEGISVARQVPIRIGTLVDADASHVVAQHDMFAWSAL